MTSINISCAAHAALHQWHSDCSDCQAKIADYALKNPDPPGMCQECGHLSPEFFKNSGLESILQEAQRLTHGPRNKDYGHPLDDYTRTAALINGAFTHLLVRPIRPDEASLIMCLVKISRQVNSPKRDNMVDLAGYAWVTQECVDETQVRKAQNSETFGPKA